MAKLKTPVGPEDHAQGDSHAPVTLVEYGDYECPHCGRAYPIVKRVQKHFGKRLRFVFRNFPLGEMHPHAESAAETSEFSGSKHKFWEMHELLFGDQSRLKLRDLLGRADALALDLKRFKAELNDEVYLEQIRADFRSGVQNGVYSTPGIFINGVRLNGESDFESLRRALDLALEEGSGSLAGTP